MKTDRELLELAAKAAGLNHYGFGSEGDMHHPRDGMEGLVIDRQKHSLGGSMVWNPLTDDGDAFRLAARIGLELHLADGSISDMDHLPIARFQVGNMGSLRLAITRVAAEIGHAL